MSSTENTKKGKIGEDMAVHFLSQRGFEILERNYRFRRSEIDIIAKFGVFLVFVEVKYRTNDLFGYPEDGISQKKVDMIKMASDEYVIQNGWHGPIRFDVVSITQKRSKTEYVLLEDAF